MCVSQPAMIPPFYMFTYLLTSLGENDMQQILIIVTYKCHDDKCFVCSLQCSYGIICNTFIIIKLILLVLFVDVICSMTFYTFIKCILYTLTALANS